MLCRRCQRGAPMSCCLFTLMVLRSMEIVVASVYSKMELPSLPVSVQCPITAESPSPDYHFA